MFNNFFWENRVIYEIMSKNVVEPERSQITTAARSMLDKQAYTPAPLHPYARIYPREGHTCTLKYVILTDFPMQRWFRERASVLCYTYIACLVAVDVRFLSLS